MKLGCNDTVDPGSVQQQNALFVFGLSVFCVSFVVVVVVFGQKRNQEQLIAEILY